MEFRDVEKRVHKICGENGWDLYNQATLLAQADKLIEEATELRDAIFAETQGIKTFIDKKGKVKNVEEEIIDGIGDTTVVLANISKMTNYDFVFCFNTSTEVISKRKGKMIDCTFVKDSE